jgi:AcrR family transcriptional regulator
MAVRMSRAERSAANRAALLDAARRVFLRDGYHGTTVDAVAKEAGLTIGALYSRFEGKADLFLALLEERVAERAVQFAAPRATGDGDWVPRVFAQRWAAIMRADLDWQLLVIEFRVHAARDAELAARYEALHELAVGTLGDNISAALPFDPDPDRVEALARAGFAAATGAALARAAEGEAFTDELYEETVVALANRFLDLEVP